MTVSLLTIMLFTILLSSFVIVCANPFHKYPFVFLLDIGNEEIETVNTKQIRVSAPGGSIALRYPAIGDGETIAHLRVSGIDFGTDLKANIINGGPGYNYVILVFVGNEDVAYDAVITIKTVPVTNGYSTEISNNTESMYANPRYNTQNTYLNTKNDISVGDNDENNSAEDLSDSEESNPNIVSNAELSQSSSNVYYVKESSVEDNEDSSNDSEEEDDGNQEESHNSHLEYSNEIHGDETGERSIEINDESNNEENELNINNDETDEPKAENYSNSDESEDEGDEEPVRLIDKNLYDKYQVLKPHLYNNFNVYPQEAFNQNASPESIDYEDPSELEQTFNDEEVHGNKYRDDNNNYSDSDYGSIDNKK